MPKMSRRSTLAALLTGAFSSAAAQQQPASGRVSPPPCTPGPSDWSHLSWARGLEGQRKADLGDGRFLNPIMAGDHPDPAILRHGDDFYMTFSSFDAYPGLVIWHSRDLVNWQPLGASLRTPIGSVWGPDFVRHGGRYYIYIPARTRDYRSIYVIHAEDVRGPWSEPIDLRLPAHIDPGHIVGEDGRRKL